MTLLSGTCLGILDAHRTVSLNKECAWFIHITCQNINKISKKRGPATMDIIPAIFNVAAPIVGAIASVVTSQPAPFSDILTTTDAPLQSPFLSTQSSSVVSFAVASTTSTVSTWMSLPSLNVQPTNSINATAGVDLPRFASAILYSFIGVISLVTLTVMLWFCCRIKTAITRPSTPVRHSCDLESGATSPPTNRDVAVALAVDARAMTRKKSYDSGTEVLDVRCVSEPLASGPMPQRAYLSATDLAVAAWNVPPATVPRYASATYQFVAPAPPPRVRSGVVASTPSGVHLVSKAGGEPL